MCCDSKIQGALYDLNKSFFPMESGLAQHFEKLRVVSLSNHTKS